MHVLYYDPCQEDCIEFEQFFSELMSQRKIPDYSRLICESDVGVLSLVGSRGGIEVGFIDFFVADQFSAQSDMIARVIHNVYPTSHLYGMIPMGRDEENIHKLVQEHIIVPEVLYKNTTFLRASQQQVLEEFAIKQERQNPSSIVDARTELRRLRLV